MTDPLPSLPFEPLRRVVASRCVLRKRWQDGAGLADGIRLLWPGDHPWQRRAYERAQQAGRLSIFAADRLAIDLGLHPALIWGDDWWDFEAVS